MFARFGTRLDARTRALLERGRRVREVLKQHEHTTLSPFEQIVVLLAVTEGLFDDLPPVRIPEAEQRLCSLVVRQFGDIGRRIYEGESLNAEDRMAILQACKQVSTGEVTDGNRANT